MTDNATHGWCPVCKAIKPVTHEELTAEDITGEYVGGDILCRDCDFIIATMYRPKDA